MTVHPEFLGYINSFNLQTTIGGSIIYSHIKDEETDRGHLENSPKSHN